MKEYVKHDIHIKSKSYKLEFLVEFGSLTKFNQEKRVVLHYVFSYDYGYNDSIS